ncbi:TSUP family transporter [Jannaschia ovalis]|uniref:Probable membrane transporter protein n=1 Tax=Jannaschia ovalis TaxID=3038773 RepID=A0ABY8LHT2_9RHOB|nr:TSUP family transporter [Jannaschia sp. GRR-S6-38]WGH79754.1 TSUP family transporter [Jannaschia sp. GRR-S6-38]
MWDGLAAALALPGFAGLLACGAAAGLVYGFAGFGAALIFIPVAAALTDPGVALASFAVMASGSVVTILPRVWPVADRAATGFMILAATLTMPLGVALLTRLPEAPLRWAICGIVAATLAAVMAGWRITLSDRALPRLGLGATAGLMGGATGLLGPVVILVTLAGGAAAARMRANMALFLTTVTLLILPTLWWQGVLTLPVFWIGLILLPVYAGATLVGQALFRPGAERVYRGLAYAVVAGAVVLGLPV